MPEINQSEITGLTRDLKFPTELSSEEITLLTNKRAELDVELASPANLNPMFQATKQLKEKIDLALEQQHYLYSEPKPESEAAGKTTDILRVDLNLTDIGNLILPRTIELTETHIEQMGDVQAELTSKLKKLNWSADSLQLDTITPEQRDDIITLLKLNTVLQLYVSSQSPGVTTVPELRLLRSILYLTNCADRQLQGNKTEHFAAIDKLIKEELQDVEVLQAARRINPKPQASTIVPPVANVSNTQTVTSAAQSIQSPPQSGTAAVSRANLNKVSSDDVKIESSISTGSITIKAENVAGLRKDLQVSGDLQGILSLDPNEHAALTKKREELANTLREKIPATSDQVIYGPSQLRGLSDEVRKELLMLQEIDFVLAKSDLSGKSLNTDRGINAQRTVANAEQLLRSIKYFKHIIYSTDYTDDNGQPFGSSAASTGSKHVLTDEEMKTTENPIKTYLKDALAPPAPAAAVPPAVAPIHPAAAPSPAAAAAAPAPDPDIEITPTSGAEKTPEDEATGAGPGAKVGSNEGTNLILPKVNFFKSKYTSMFMQSFDAFGKIFKTFSFQPVYHYLFIRPAAAAFNIGTGMTAWAIGKPLQILAYSVTIPLGAATGLDLKWMHGFSDNLVKYGEDHDGTLPLFYKLSMGSLQWALGKGLSGIGVKDENNIFRTFAQDNLNVDKLTEHFREIAPLQAVRAAPFVPNAIFQPANAMLETGVFSAGHTLAIGGNCIGWFTDWMRGRDTQGYKDNIKAHGKGVGLNFLKGFCDIVGGVGSVVVDPVRALAPPPLTKAGLRTMEGIYNELEKLDIKDDEGQNIFAEKHNISRWYMEDDIRTLGGKNDPRYGWRQLRDTRFGKWLTSKTAAKIPSENASFTATSAAASGSNASFTATSAAASGSNASFTATSTGARWFSADNRTMQALQYARKHPGEAASIIFLSPVIFLLGIGGGILGSIMNAPSAALNKLTGKKGTIVISSTDAPANTANASSSTVSLAPGVAPASGPSMKINVPPAPAAAPGADAVNMTVVSKKPQPAANNTAAPITGGMTATVDVGNKSYSQRITDAWNGMPSVGSLVPRMPHVSLPHASNISLTGMGTTFVGMFSMFNFTKERSIEISIVPPAPLGQSGGGGGPAPAASSADASAAAQKVPPAGNAGNTMLGG